jgi:ferredoxin-like protein FixX
MSDDKFRHGRVNVESRLQQAAPRFRLRDASAEVLLTDERPQAEAYDAVLACPAPLYLQ